MDKRKLLKAFTDNDEKLQFAKIIDLASSRADKVYSDFIDPVRASKYIALLKSQGDFGMNYMAYGGADNCERKMLGFSQGFIELAYDDFPIDTLVISYNTMYSKELSHRDYLGSIIGLGIDRSRVGDIILSDKGCAVFISKEISGYVAANLERVGNVKVGVRFAEDVITDGMQPAPGLEKRTTLASLRIDNIVSAALNISRSKSAALFAGDKVFVNWTLVKNGSKLANENDVITVRGYGRVQLKEIIGVTKKDRIAVILLC